MNRKTVYIKNGGKYAAQQRLAHTFAQIGSETVSTATITFLGETIEKRLLLNSAGMFELLLSDVLDAIKTNTYSFKPFNDFALDEFKPLTIEGDFDAIAVEVLNAIDSPDSFVNSGDFMSRNTEIQFDERFEQGFHFYGEIEIERETTDGADTLTIGQADELNFVSFRGLLRLPSTPVVSYYNGTTTGAVQGETATYEVTADNLTGNAGAVEVAIDFGGAIGTDSQTVNFAANETGKVITFTASIPSDEGTPRTAEITDNVGSVPYSWQYDILSYTTFEWYNTAGETKTVLFNSNAASLINWGDGTSETIPAGINTLTKAYSSVGMKTVTFDASGMFADTNRQINLDYSANDLRTFDFKSASFKGTLKIAQNANNQNFTSLSGMSSDSEFKSVQLSGTPVGAIDFNGSQIVGADSSFGMYLSQTPNLTALSNMGATAGSCRINLNNANLTGEVNFNGLTATANGRALGLALNANMTRAYGFLLSSSITGVEVDQCALTASSVDEIIQICVDSGLVGKTLELQGGTSAAPSASGLANIVTLQGNGWTVTTN